MAAIYKSSDRRLIYLGTEAFGGSSVIQSTLSVGKVREDRPYPFTVCSQECQNNMIAGQRTLSALLLNFDDNDDPAAAEYQKDEVTVYIQQRTL